MIIGITGGIGSGKSTIANELARRGYKVYDCDKEAKRIIAENTSVRKAVIGLLGTEAFISSPQHPFTRQYNTAYVAQRVFAEPGLLEQLNAIVHPAVTRDIIEKKPDFIESAILHEAGLDRLCDKIIAIEAPEAVRIARTIDRDYHGEASPENIDKVRARMNAQKEQHARIHIYNDGNTPIAQLVEKITQLM